MEEGVATQMRGGDTSSTPSGGGGGGGGGVDNGPEVTGVGWSLPCSLSSLLAMNCRARAEELARRLQSRMNGQSLEHTSLVSPNSDGPYASMECRHSSLDEPFLDHLEENNLRPIHVVTSEPTLHLRLPPPPPPPLKHMREQDSDVYYDFDLASPDEVVAEVEEEDDDGEGSKTHSFANGDRPESGCVTSVTSPLMFGNESERDDDVGPDGDGIHLGVPRDFCSPDETMVCSPDADLRAVRDILTTASTLQEEEEEEDEDEEEEGRLLQVEGRVGKRRRRGQLDERFHSSGGETGGGDAQEGVGMTDGESENCELVVSVCCDKDSDYEDVIREGCSSSSSSFSRGGPSRSDSAFSEGATDGSDKWQHLCQEGWSGQVDEMPVANSEHCWCHTTALGTEPVCQRHIPASSPPSTDSYSARARAFFYGEYGALEGHVCVGSDAPVMTDETCKGDFDDDKNKSGVDCETNEGEIERGREVATAPRQGSLEGGDLPEGTKKSEDQHQQEEENEEEDEVTKTSCSSLEKEGKEEEEEESRRREEREFTGASAESISGSIQPLLAESHLYAPSQGQEQPAEAAAAAAGEMEARSGSEGDLRSKDEVFCADSDNEVIETLGEDDDANEDEDDDENEEDVEEEVILTGKFKNIRGYTERVRRLSDDVEDRPPPPVIIKHEGEGDVSDLPGSPTKYSEDEERLSTSDLSSQLSQLDIDAPEEEEEEVENAEGGEEEEVTPSESRSSSEEVDPARIEDFKMRIKRSSSLKCGKTPPGTPGRKKIVRFADVLGLDLAAVRTFLGGVPHVPRSAFWDLEVDKEAAASSANTSTASKDGGTMPMCVPRRVLTPLFQQPGCHPDFIDRVRHQKVVIESVMIGEDMSVRGVIRVMSMSFHKNVYVRYTFDQWRNYHEATATYVPNSHDGATDRFSFLLWGSFLQDNGALAFCVRYCTMGQEFWDNNYGRNYTLQCYTSMGMVGESGTNTSRPQNSHSVQQYMSQGSQSTVSGHYHSFGSPETPHDPWVTRFF